jgi:putative ATP-dependent endonuclease of OLD family
MEEPEIALPPHTQRRIANYLLENTAQCLVTSHSPYVIERFHPAQIQVLRKDDNGRLSSIPVPGSSVLKGKTYRKHARRGLAEAMLGRGVIVGEGITEKDALLATAEKMEEADPENYYPLDLSGVTVLSTDGDGSIPEFGAFFRAMQIKVFALYDTRKRKPEEAQKLNDNFDISCETKYKGAEKLLTEEVPVPRLWQFLTELRDSGDDPEPVLPAVMPDEAAVRTLSYNFLAKEKGSGHAARVIGCCDFAELPPTIVEFLKQIYALFPKPTPIPPIDEAPQAEEPPSAEPAQPAA